MILVKNEEQQTKLALVILFIINIYWFSTYRFHTLMGDDLTVYDNFKNYQGSFWDYTFTQLLLEKYRPVFNFFQYGLLKMFGTDHTLYTYANLFLNFIIVFMLFNVIKLVTKGNVFFAFIFSLLYITARFAYYNVLQLYGTMESMAVLFLLLIVYYSILFFTKKENEEKHFFWIIFYDVLIIFTHERYLVLTAFIILLILLRGQLKENIRQKVICSVIAALPVLLNVILKIWLHAPVLLGTGGQSIKPDIVNILSFFRDGLLNILGVNVGPEYLVGMPFENSSSSVAYTSFLIAVIIILVLTTHIAQIIQNSENKRKEYNYLILAAVLIGSLLLTASITVRQELRWIYPAYVILLILLAYAVNKAFDKEYLKYAVIIGLMCCIISNDNYYKGYIKYVSFMYSQTISDSAYDETVKKYGTSLSNYKVVIEKKGDELNWPLLGSLFFQTYINNPKFEVTYVDDLSKENFNRNDNLILLKMDWPNRKLVNVNDEYLKR